MSAVPTRHTSLERLLYDALKLAGVRIRRQPPLFGHPDLKLIGAKVVVFVDSCFWHGCRWHGTIPRTNRELWRAKFARNRVRDGEVNAHLRALGYTVIRIWEHELRRNMRKSVARLRRGALDAN